MSVTTTTPTTSYGSTEEDIKRALAQAYQNNTLNDISGISLKQQASTLGINVDKYIEQLKSQGIVPSAGTPEVSVDAANAGVAGANIIQRNPAPVNENYNSVTGGNPWASWKGALGTTDANGATSTGWVAPALTGALDIGKTVLAYQNLKETKKMNEFNIAAKEEALARQAIDQKNKIAKANINRGIGMGNANSMPVQLVARNPYSVYNTFNPNR